jgi:hypothetical protein
MELTNLTRTYETEAGRCIIALQPGVENGNRGLYVADQKGKRAILVYVPAFYPGGEESCNPR